MPAIWWPIHRHQTPIRPAAPESGSLLLHEDARLGQYKLEITVTDSAASPPRTVAQSIDFEVR